MRMQCARQREIRKRYDLMSEVALRTRHKAATARHRDPSDPCCM